MIPPNNFDRHLERSLGVGLDRVRADHATEAYAKVRCQRKVSVKPLFAEVKGWHGPRRIRLRGLEKANGKALLIAASQNLKRLPSRGGWGRCPQPNGAAGLVLPIPAPAPPTYG